MKRSEMIKKLSGLIPELKTCKCTNNACSEKILVLIEESGMLPPPYYMEYDPILSSCELYDWEQE